MNFQTAVDCLLRAKRMTNHLLCVNGNWNYITLENESKPSKIWLCSEENGLINSDWTPSLQCLVSDGWFVFSTPVATPKSHDLWTRIAKTDPGCFSVSQRLGCKFCGQSLPNDVPATIRNPIYHSVDCLWMEAVLVVSRPVMKPLY